MRIHYSQLKHTFIIYMSVILSGCMSKDLLTEGNLPENLKQVAIEMRLRTESRCVTYSYEQGSGTKVSGDTKIASKVVLRRLYVSDGNWYKAEIIGNGVVDYVFYSLSTGVFICGDRTWNTYSDSKGVIFREYGSSDNTVGIPQRGNVPSTSPTTLPRSSDVRSIAVSWEGYSKLISGTIDLTPNSNNPGSFRVKLPNDEGQCSGQTKQIDRKTGVWSISCSNGMSAAGTFEAYGEGKGSSGIGIDSKGKEVRFTMSGRD